MACVAAHVVAPRTAPALNITNSPSQMLYKNGLLYVAGASVINYDNQTVFVYAYNVSANYAYVLALSRSVDPHPHAPHQHRRVSVRTAWSGPPPFPAARPASLPSSPT